MNMEKKLVKGLVKGVDYDGWAIRDKETGRYYSSEVLGIHILASATKRGIFADDSCRIVRVKLVEVEP